MSIDAMKQALEALIDARRYGAGDWSSTEDALRLAIEQAEKQEPVAWLYRDAWGTLKLSEIMPPPVGSFPVYTAPPNRQPLTREQVLECEREADAAYVATRADELRPSWASIFARAIERKHGIGGGE